MVESCQRSEAGRWPSGLSSRTVSSNWPHRKYDSSSSAGRWNLSLEILCASLSDAHEHTKCDSYKKKLASLLNSYQQSRSLPTSSKSLSAISHPTATCSNTIITMLGITTVAVRTTLNNSIYLSLTRGFSFADYYLTSSRAGRLRHRDSSRHSRHSVRQISCLSPRRFGLRSIQWLRKLQTRDWIRDAQRKGYNSMSCINAWTSKDSCACLPILRATSQLTPKRYPPVPGWGKIEQYAKDTYGTGGWNIVVNPAEVRVFL